MEPRGYFAEALGTFSMVFAGTGAIVANTVSGGEVMHVGIALTFRLLHDADLVPTADA